ncbi:MAG: peptidylprolyl isomerase [Chthoniobacterales bacterium]
MKLSRFSSRLATVLSCTALLGAANALNAADEAAPAPADKASGETTVTPPAPAAKPIELPETVAVVNGEKISRAELEKALDNAVKMSGMDASKLSDDQKLQGYHQFLNDIIIERLLKAKSADIKITDAEVDAKIADIKKNFPDEKAFNEQLKQAGLDDAKLHEQLKNSLAETKWIQSQIAGKADVTPADVQAFYKENGERFKVPDEQVRASHILISTQNAKGEDLTGDELKAKEAAAKAAYKKATADDADFAKLANELSEDPGNKPPGGKPRGGDLYYFSKGQMVPEFEKQAYSMKVGEISEPVKSKFGYHIIKLTGKLPAGGSIPLDDELKEQLTMSLKGQKEQAAVHDVIDKLRTSAKVTDNLPPLPPAAAAPPTGVDAGAGEAVPAPAPAQAE